MVHSDDWIEYKNLILERLDEIEKIEKDVVILKIQLAILTTKVVIITTSVAIGTSAVVAAIANNFFIKGA